MWGQVGRPWILPILFVLTGWVMETSFELQYLKFIVIRNPGKTGVLNLLVVSLTLHSLGCMMSWRIFTEIWLICLETNSFIWEEMKFILVRSISFVNCCRISKHLYPWASLCKQVCSPSLNHGLKSMILLTWTDLWTNCTTIILYLNMLQNFNLQPMLSAWIYLCNKIEWILMSIYSIMFLVCDHVTAKYFWIQPCKNGDGSDDQHSTTTHSVDFSGNACVKNSAK